MINKANLQSIISKYYLGGLCESTKWVIKDKKLTINFMSPSKEMLGKVEYNNFDLENIDLAIFNTTQLNKLLSVTTGDLELKISKLGKIANKLNVSDLRFDLTYALADVMLIGKVAEIDEPDFEIEVNLDQDNITDLIKSKTALIDDDNFIIETSLGGDGSNVLLFTFGDNVEYSNKISYAIKTDSIKTLPQIPFNSNVLKEILNSNKDMEKGKLFINSEGLLKLVFVKDGFKSEYFLVRKPEV